MATIVVPCASSARPVLRMYRGDTFVQEFQFRRSIGSAVPTPVDLTGAEIWATVKHTVVQPDNTALAQKTTASGIAVDAVPTTGKFTLTLDPADTAYLPDGVSSLVFDIQVREAGGRVSTVLLGTLEIVPDVTRTF